MGGGSENEVVSKNMQVLIQVREFRMMIEHGSKGSGPTLLSGTKRMSKTISKMAKNSTPTGFEPVHGNRTRCY